MITPVGALRGNVTALIEAMDLINDIHPRRSRNDRRGCWLCERHGPRRNESAAREFPSGASLTLLLQYAEIHLRIAVARVHDRDGPGPSDSRRRAQGLTTGRELAGVDLGAGPVLHRDGCRAG